MVGRFPSDQFKIWHLLLLDSYKLVAHILTITWLVTLYDSVLLQELTLVY